MFVRGIRDREGVGVAITEQREGVRSGGVGRSGYGGVEGRGTFLPSFSHAANVQYKQRISESPINITCFPPTHVCRCADSRETLRISQAYGRY
jgi:hypothetical protein